MSRTLVDPFELQRSELRPQALTLLDPFELRERFESVDLAADWEEPTRHKCRVIIEAAPRGVGYEAWRRARAWGADDELRSK
jgi:hypothetical protein